MNVLIFGGAGLLGQKLAQALYKRETLRGQQISKLVLADVIGPQFSQTGKIAVECHQCDIANPSEVARVLNQDIDVVFHLAAIVSAQAEAEFDLGMDVNLKGVMNILERARALETSPVVVFSSSIAVYGGEVPDPITAHSFLNPQTSYGTQKAIGELLINDYSRRGFIDGRGFRLPTISIRPGKPNRAASGFMSSILREPLNGQTANCPVNPEFSHYYLSPRKCVANLILGAELEAEALGQNRNMLMPGRRWTIAEVIEAMTNVAGPEPAKRITWNSDPEIEAIVNGWRFDIRPEKAFALGLEADESFEDNLRYYLEDDMP